MTNIDYDDVIKVVRNIFRATRTQAPETFQEWVLKEVKKLIPFDSCKWGSGIIVNDQVIIHNIHLHNLPDDDLDIYLNRQKQDVLLAKLTTTRDKVITYDRYDITPREHFIELPFYKEYCQKFGLEQLISTMVPEPVSNLYSVISFFRNDFNRPFSKREKRIKTIITPALTEARSHNIFINMVQSTREAHLFAAISDAKGILREAEYDFAELMQEEWPNWQGPLLNFTPGKLLNGQQTAHFEGENIFIYVSTQHDLVLLEGRRKSALDSLTKAEKKVSTFLLLGLANKEIALKLNISPKTVGHHLQKIYKKTGVENRKQAIAKLGKVVSGLPCKRPFYVFPSSIY